MSEPTTLQAGDSVAWSASVPDALPSDGWALKYRVLWPSGAAHVDIAATADGDGYTVSLAASSTANWPAGNVSLAKWVERGSERRTIAVLSMEVLPNLANAVAFDGRSRNVRALEAAEAALLAYAEGGKAHVAEYEIDGKRMRFRSTKEITDLIGYYSGKVARERSTAVLLAGGTPGRVNVRM